MPSKPDCTKLQKTIAQLALNLALRPDIKNLDGVTAELTKHLPAISRREIAESIVAHSASKGREVSDAAKKLAQIRNEARSDQRLRAAIGQAEQALKTGVRPAKPTPPVPKADPAAIARLKRELEGLQKQLAGTDPAKRQAIRDRIAQTETHIKNGTVPPTRPAPKTPADIQALRRELADKQRQMWQADPALRLRLKSEINELEGHLAAGTSPATKPAPARKATPADLAALRTERASLQRQVDQAQRLESRIAELQTHIDAGTLPPPPGIKPAPHARIATLQSALAGVRKALDQSEPALQDRWGKQIAEMQDRLAAGAFEAPEKPIPTPLSKNLERLSYERDRLRGEIRQRIDALRPKTFWVRAATTAGEPINLARSLMTSLDLSATLRQGGMIGLAHPTRAAKALSASTQAWASKTKAHAIHEEILNRDNAPEYHRAGLYIAPEDGALGQQEEAFMSRLASKIPGIAGSQRAYTTHLNVLRADSFDSMLEAITRSGDATAAEAKALANYINAATGRGPLPGLERAAATMNTVFFAPRYFTSRIQLLIGQPLYGGTWRTRKLIAQEYARSLAGIGVVFALGAAAGGTIGTDPRSSDFAKIRFGNTRLDPLMGMQQTLVLASRLRSGQITKQGGQVVDIRGPHVPFGGRKPMDLLVTFGRSKLSPGAGAATDLVTSSDAFGQPATPWSVAGRLAVPLSGRDIYESMREHGVPEGAALGLLSALGMGVQNYEEQHGRH